jgi:prepilin-type N-terminal cleavage/methylation domain-containing protein
MIRKSDGFTLVELMITMIVFVLVIVGASQVFTGLLTQFKQQSKISETNTAGVAGLEILRRDIEQAGYGLPWDLNSATYRETTAESGMTDWVDRDFNDGPDTNPWRGCSSGAQSDTCDVGGGSNPPAPFRSGDDEGITTGSGSVTNSQADVLVIKSATVGMNTASQKWTYIVNRGALGTNTLKVWNSTDDPVNTDQLISLELINGNKYNLLQHGASSNDFYVSLNDSDFSFNSSATNSSSFEPAAYSYKQFVLYDIAPADGNSSHIRMPFNRADYFVKRTATNMPARCAPNTGILYKAVTNNTLNKDGQANGGGRMTPYPILDCVADMQVVYLLDNADSTGGFSAKGDGTVDWCPTCASCGGDTHTASPTASPTGDISCLTAYEIRNEVKEVRVYIVAQEGQRDTTYDFSQGGTRTSFSATIADPNGSGSDVSLNMVNLSSLVGNPEYKYYRWKLYTLVVNPDSMR